MADSRESTSSTGAERAAILLMSLGEKEAAEILKHMGPKEVQKVGEAMASLSNISREQVTGILNEFVSSVDNETALGVDADQYIRNVLEGALGEAKAAGLIDRILLGSNSKGLEQLKWMDARQVAELIRLEHPQIIAIVLSYLDHDQSAEVLDLLPEETRLEVMLRVSTLDGIQPSALQELNEIIEKQFSGTSKNVKSSSLGGIKTAASILNLVDSAIEAQIVDKMKEVDADLGQQIQDHMFVFDDLVTVDDRGIQALLREVSSESLILALKGADESVREKIFHNMSKRAGEMLRDDLEAKGPVRLSEVDMAQKEIISIARRMAEAGEIALGGKGGEEYV